ncbi:response regulator [Pseudoalteromonas fenneropenaei]|uniref:histidine kinase n=1 Tax=Pseudoalteromonas fenneropenaei TaxID=1737459 RepID=A0ABV7CND2_9GAMM
MSATQQNLLGRQAVKLLLVEDDEDDFILTEARLAEIDDFVVELCWLRNLDDAKTALLHGGFDLCLLDYRLGHQSGLTLLDFAKQQQLSTPIIMLTGQVDAELDDAALKAGAEDFVAKYELGSARFVRAIRYALARTELKKERLERLKAEAENRAKDQFLAHLSHELRTPLTSILGYTELLLQNVNQAEHRSELGIIYNNGEHLLKLLDDVLDLSKLHAHTLQLDVQPMSVCALQNSLYDIFSLSAQSKQIGFVIQSNVTERDWVCCDQTRLKQVLINLIYNAIKFTFQGQVTVKVCKAQQRLHFEVADSGIGIPADDLARVFAPFTQVQDTTTKVQQGAGLGLAISADLVALMGGKLVAESELGVGSCFSFSIDAPQCAEPQPQPQVEGSLAQTQWRPPLGTMALVVEDNPDIQTLLQTHLTHFGYQVAVVASGEQALTRLAQTPTSFAVVLLDLHLPNMSGREVLAAIRAKDATLPVIAVTAAAQAGTKEELMALGCHALVSKPIAPLVLQATLTEVLQGAKPPTPQPKARQRRDVMVVEDDKDSRELMLKLLHSFGVQATGVGSALECEQLLPQRHWHCVMLDIGLPDKNGLVLAEGIRAQYPECSIIIISGYEPDPNVLMKLKISQVLLKPVTLTGLKSVFD